MSNFHLPFLSKYILGLIRRLVMLGTCFYFWTLASGHQTLAVYLSFNLNTYSLFIHPPQFKVVVIIDPKTGDASDIYQDLEVELVKKPGKGLGLSVVGRRDGNGVFISDMVILQFSCFNYCLFLIV